MNKQNIVLVNVTRSLEDGQPVATAAQGGWYAQSDAQEEELFNVRTVVAVAHNVVVGIYTNKSTSFDSDDPYGRTYCSFDLATTPQYQHLINTHLPMTLMWVQGFAKPWFTITDEDMALIGDVYDLTVGSFGPYQAIMTDIDTIDVVHKHATAPIIMRAPFPSDKDDIDDILIDVCHGLLQKRLFTTYGTLAAALDRHPRWVAQRVTAIRWIDKNAGAHVMPSSFIKKNGFITIPAQDSFTSADGDTRSRAQVLIEQGYSCEPQATTFHMGDEKMILDPRALRMMFGF